MKKEVYDRDLRSMYL